MGTDRRGFLRELWKPAVLSLLGMGIFWSPWMLLHLLRQPELSHGEVLVSGLFYFTIFSFILLSYLALKGTRFRLIVVERGMDDAEEEDRWEGDSEEDQQLRRSIHLPF